jgi:uncharacterized Tic20 family protein
MLTVSEFIQMMQASIASVAMISGVGLLLLSMTNRYGRTIDRLRLLIKEAAGTTDAQNKAKLAFQIKVMYERCRIVRMAVILASSSIFFVALTILLIFVSQLLSVNPGMVTVTAFSLSLVCLVISLMFLIKDLTISLKAVETEIKDWA